MLRAALVPRQVSRQYRVGVAQAGLACQGYSFTREDARGSRRGESAPHGEGSQPGVSPGLSPHPFPEHVWRNLESALHDTAVHAAAMNKTPIIHNNISLSRDMLSDRSRVKCSRR